MTKLTSIETCIEIKQQFNPGSKQKSILTKAKEKVAYKGFTFTETIIDDPSLTTVAQSPVLLSNKMNHYVNQGCPN